MFSIKKSFGVYVMAGYVGRTFAGVQNVCVVIIFSWLAGCSSGGSSSGEGNNNPSSSSSSSTSSSSSSSSSSNPLPSSFSISGTLQGNAGSVTLSLNGQQQAFSGNSFTFTRKINQGEHYNVLFVSESTDKVCTVTNGGGIAQSNVNNIYVNCAAQLSVLRFNATEVLGNLVSGDFNGDGFSDLALTTLTYPEHPAGQGRRFTKFLLGNGAGSFPTENDVETISAGHPTSSSVSVDFNGDGYDDYVLWNEMYLGNSNGAPVRSFVADHVGRIATTIDINGDGRLDILTRADDNRLGLYFGLQINNGDGTFAPIEEFLSRLDLEERGMSWSFGVVNYTLADVNGDGITDIVAICGKGVLGGDLVLQILHGNDAGGFDLADDVIDLPDDLKLDPDVLRRDSKEIASGDFDGDGDIDLAFTSDTSFMQIMVNDGVGNFTQGQRVIVGTQPMHIRAADFNQDGKLDLVTANAKSNTIHISYGIGDGTFGDSTGAQESWVSIDLVRNSALVNTVVADFDGDGAPDIAIAENGTNPAGTDRGSVQIVFAASL
jgi:hypothetical protein